MKIRPQNEMVRRPTKQERARKAQQQEWSDEEAKDFLSGGVDYIKSRAVGRFHDWWFGLDDSPSYRLERPVLFIQGFNGRLSQFETTLRHLSKNEENGPPIYVKEGSFFSDPECSKLTEVRGEHRVFRLVHDTLSTPVETAAQIELATLAIRKATGFERCDAIAHSMGGLSARCYLDQGHRFHKLAMVGTPNQGSRAAQLTMSALVNSVTWATTIARVPTAALPALNWLVPVEDGNPALSLLNARWEIQKRNAQDIAVFGASGLQTAYGQLALGDGVVGMESLPVGDAKVHLFEGGGTKNHSTLVSDSEVLAALAEFFSWQSSEGL